MCRLYKWKQYGHVYGWKCSYRSEGLEIEMCTQKVIQQKEVNSFNYFDTYNQLEFYIKFLTDCKLKWLKIGEVKPMSNLIFVAFKLN